MIASRDEQETASTNFAPIDGLDNRCESAYAGWPDMEFAMNNVSRRKFLKRGAMTTASVALMTALPERLMAKSLAKSPGIQLYTVGDPLTKDMDGTLAKLAAMGYRTVESA